MRAAGEKNAVTAIVAVLSNCDASENPSRSSVFVCGGGDRFSRHRTGAAARGAVLSRRLHDRLEALLQPALYFPEDFLEIL
jgi:hypothetical protein